MMVAFAAIAVQHLGGMGGGGESMLGGVFAPLIHSSRLTRFYLTYAPDKVAGVPGVLAKYRGRERLLYRKLAEKYGVDNGEETWRADMLSTARAVVEAIASYLEAHGAGESV
eukprot:CAMPEP_0119278274 /NCGR_PEP_ID=MMETSP1329-20130426/18805_1 /TAXON_ID=114041 /ORGANISM="Genus nov. species nov., Strain RCC1024" /LENGTH=111 /DNA_ID=CAMNT_0007278781 /DNA_START=179 /DNA_END=510 /DNA_ORIENTATION=-